MGLLGHRLVRFSRAQQTYFFRGHDWLETAHGNPDPFLVVYGLQRVGSAPFCPKRKPAAVREPHMRDDPRHTSVYSGPSCVIVLVLAFDADTHGPLRTGTVGIIRRFPIRAT